MARIAYAWVIDGIGTIFVTDEALDTAWAEDAGFVAAYTGLQLPTGLSCGVDLRSGLLTDDTASLEVLDLDGTLAALFRAERTAYDTLINTLEPGTTGGSVPTAAKGKHVGLEYISADGDRRQYSCVPGFNIGLKHYGQVEAAANELGVTPVSDLPILWSGRRCAVYQVEEVGGTWQSLANATRVWWGTMRGRGSYKGGKWSFACYGPQSWTSGNLGRGMFQRALDVRASSTIADPRLWAYLDVVELKSLQPEHVYGTVDDFFDDTYLVGVDNYADAAAALNNFLDDVVSSTANGTEFNDDSNDISFSTVVGQEGISVLWRRGLTKGGGDGDPYVDAADPITLTARIIIEAHETTWAMLGYDVRIQNKEERDAVDHVDQYGRFYPSADGFWLGEFLAAQPSVIKAFDEGTVGQAGNSEDDYQDASGRIWPTLYPGGAVFFTGVPLQEFELISSDEVLLPNSKARPLPADPDDDSSAYTISNGVGLANAQTLLVLDGPYRRRGDKDSVDPVEGYAFELERERREGRTVQVVRAAFRRNAGGTVSRGSGEFPRLVVMQWYDPRLFGFDFKPLDGTWGGFADAPPGAEQIKAAPLVAWDVRDGADKVTEVIQRVLLSTGTAGAWYSDAGLTTPLYGTGGGAAYLDVGDNDTGGTVPKDAEDSTLGLGVPASMVRPPSHYLAAEAVLGPELQRCKVASASVLSARDLFSRLLSPTGLALSLSGGKYGLVDAWALPTPQDASLVITTELYAGKAGQPRSATASQALRKWSPIDRIEIKGRVDPQTGEYVTEEERAATDAGAVYRSEQIRHTITGDYLISPRLATLGASWFGELLTRWRSGFAFWAADHTVVTVPLHAEDALGVWPGDGVLITDPELLSASGQYGVSAAAARVISRVFDAAKRSVTLTMLVGDDAAMRLYAPAALVTSYDSATYRLHCADDWLDDRTDELDVDGFIEPSWSSEGGNASIEVLQFDGASWTGGIYGTVTSVNSVAGSCYLQLASALTGAAYYADKITVAVLREWSSQNAAWALRWHGPITEDDGTHSSGTAGVPFVGV